MIEVWLVRHGETDWNHQGRMQGWSDIPLNANGLQQAQRLAQMLHGLPFHAVYASDLSRARKTAEIVQSQLNAPLIETAALRERCFGSGEGLTRQEIQQRYPDGPPGAEPEDQVLERVQTFLESLRLRHRKGRILCVTHGGFIRAALRAFGIQQPPQLANTCVNRLVCLGKGWQVVAVNEAGHLAADTTGTALLRPAAQA